MEEISIWVWLTLEQMWFPLRLKLEVWNNAMSSVRIKPHFFGAYHHRFHSKNKNGTLWWEARKCPWNTKFRMQSRRSLQDIVQPVAHQSTSPRKFVQQKWSSTGKTADAVGSAFQTAGRWWHSVSAGTRSKLVFRLRDTERSICQNPRKVASTRL